MLFLIDNVRRLHLQGGSSRSCRPVQRALSARHRARPRPRKPSSGPGVGAGAGDVEPRDPQAPRHQRSYTKYKSTTHKLHSAEKLYKPLIVNHGEPVGCAVGLATRTSVVHSSSSTSALVPATPALLPVPTPGAAWARRHVRVCASCRVAAIRRRWWRRAG